MLPRAACALLLVASSAACIGPRAPNASLPYAVRLLGAADGALRGEIHGGRSVFSGSVGRDYAIEVTNNTPRNVGFTIVVDGFDAVTGAPTDSCHDLPMWTLGADSRSTARGFFVSDTQISTYRFAPPARALAAIAKGGRRSAIGTIEVCIFSLKPAAPRETTEAGAFSFRGVVESDDPNPPSPPVVGELREEQVSSSKAREVEADQLVSRIVVGYVDEEGAPLGTAPPPAGIVRVVRPPRPEPEPTFDEPELGKPPKTTKPPKGPKPPKTPKAPKAPKGTSKEEK